MIILKLLLFSSIILIVLCIMQFSPKEFHEPKMISILSYCLESPQLELSSNWGYHSKTIASNSLIYQFIKVHQQVDHDEYTTFPIESILILLLGIILFCFHIGLTSLSWSISTFIQGDESNYQSLSSILPMKCCCICMALFK